VLLVTVLVAIATTATATLAVVYFYQRKPSESSAADLEPYAQQGSVKPEGQVSGTVYYPQPYGSPPHLTLSPATRYYIARQDELGFTWIDRHRYKHAPDLAKEFPELGRMIGNQSKTEEKTETPQPELSWEAKGLRAGSNAGAMRLFQQKGSFQCTPGQEGDVYFPLPYASPPNVELTSLEVVTVVDCTASSFRWKSKESSSRESKGTDVTWIAKGIKTSRESLQSEINSVRSQADSKPKALFKQEGVFTPIVIEGEVYFPYPYAAPPNVELFATDRDHKRYHASWATVAECKPTSFKWKVESVALNPLTLIWVAKGMRE
jgi:hypothetical protein